MTNLKLGKIAEIQFGPHLKANSVGNTKFLMASHFDGNLKPTAFNRSYVDLDERSERFLLQPNDVILAGKGHRTFAWAYHENFGPAVPSSLFYLLRAPQNQLIGAYLAAVLNSERLQYQLGLIGAGATITSIPKRELSEIELSIPSIQEQQRFLEIYQLLEKDIELTHELLAKKRTLKRGLINELLTKNH